MDKVILEELQKRIPCNYDLFETDADYQNTLMCIISDAKDIALSTLYPFEDYSTIELPAKYKNWVISCCIELYNLADKQGVVSYGENGISWSKKTDGISEQLLSRLTPKVGIPRRKETEEE